MEFSARKTLIGSFALMVIVAVFLFLYWLTSAGGFGPRSEYQVRFTVPVSGIAVGGNVLFNGFKVGEIAAIRFDTDKPSDTLATILVDRNAPVRSDTKVGIDYQGLTGAANILLTGGQAATGEVVPEKNGLRELIAQPADSRSLTQNASRVLTRLENMFDENKDRFSSILAGLERLTGGDGTSAGDMRYDIKVPNFSGSGDEIQDWRLVISEPNILLSFNTDRIQEMVSENAWQPLGEARWTDNVPNLFQTKIIQSFENAGYAGALARPSDVLDPQFRLSIDIRAFHFRNQEAPMVEMDLVAKILDEDGIALSSRRFASSEHVKSRDVNDAVSGFNTLFAREIQALVAWAADVL